MVFSLTVSEGPKVTTRAALELVGGGMRLSCGYGAGASLKSQELNDLLARVFRAEEGGRELHGGIRNIDFNRHAEFKPCQKAQNLSAGISLNSTLSLVA